MSSIRYTPSFSVCAPRGRIKAHRGRQAFPRRVLSIKPHTPPFCQTESTLSPLFYIPVAPWAQAFPPIRAKEGGGHRCPPPRGREEKRRIIYFDRSPPRRPLGKGRLPEAACAAFRVPLPRAFRQRRRLRCSLRPERMPGNLCISGYIVTGRYGPFVNAT